MRFEVLQVGLAFGVSDRDTEIWIWRAYVWVSTSRGSDSGRGGRVSTACGRDPQRGKHYRRAKIHDPGLENTIGRTADAFEDSADAIECHATDTCNAAAAICSAAAAFGGVRL